MEYILEQAHLIWDPEKYFGAPQYHSVILLKPAVQLLQGWQDSDSVTSIMAQRGEWVGAETPAGQM